MSYILNDLFTTLHKINIADIDHDKLIIKPILKKSSNTSINYYNNVKSIYNGFQSWFNPAKYLFTFEQKYSEPFFAFNNDNLINMIKNKQEIYDFDNHDKNREYTILNIIQHMTILDKYNFILKHKKYIYINKHSKTNLFYFLLNYMQANSSFKYDIEMDKLSLSNKDYTFNPQLNKKYELMLLFISDAFHGDEFNKNEIYNTENMLISLSFILNNIDIGGTAIIYIPSIFEKSTQSIIMILQLFFANVHIYHPHFYMYSWANWLICENYEPLNNKFHNKLLLNLNDVVLSIDLSNKKPYNSLFSNKIFNNYQLYNSALYTFNNIVYKNNEMFLTPPKFDKNAYLRELLEIYMNLNPLLKINNYYVKRSLFYDIKYSLKYENVLLININDDDVYEHLINNKYTKNISMLNDNIRFTNSISNLCKINNTELIIYETIHNTSLLFDLIIIKNDDYKIMKLLKIWSVLKDNCIIIFFNEKYDNLKCFIKEISYKIIENNSNIVIKKIDF